MGANVWPTCDEEYFEWIDLIESVEARDSYTMIDLGAGFGRWAVRAAYAVRQHHPGRPYRFVAVEAEPSVFASMRRHFTDNRIDPDHHSVIHGAMVEAPGDVASCIGGPAGSGFDLPVSSWYGQFVAGAGDLSGESREDGDYCGFKVLRHENGWRSIRVPGITLTSLLAGFDRVDLIDLDIEGQELAVIRSSIEEVSAKVKRLHVATHSKEIEAGLRQLLSLQGWNCRADYSLDSTCETEWGLIHFENGVQTWINPRV